MSLAADMDSRWVSATGPKSWAHTEASPTQGYYVRLEMGLSVFVRKQTESWAHTEASPKRLDDDSDGHPAEAQHVLCATAAKDG